METPLSSEVTADNDYEVIIAGAGPVGLTLANLLGIRGVRVLVLEKEIVAPDTPRAVSLDDESLRIWQQCGLIDVIMPFVAQGAEGDEVFTYRNRFGRAIFSLTQHGRPYGYARGNVFLFHRALEVLKSGLDRFATVTLRHGWNVQSFRQLSDAVILVAQDCNGSCCELTASYLVGCDGGRSVIRNGLQIAMLGSAYAESWLIADTWDSTMAGQSPREGVEVWCDSRCPTASIPLPDGYRRWEFLLRHGQDPAACLDDASILHLIAQRKSQNNVKVLRRLVHTYKGSVAEHYRRERVFLAGDAAHLSPPFAGQGLATGLRDAANLAWKLAHVLSGMDSAELLDSYEEERRPHQVKMLRLARRMGMMMMPRMRLQEVLVTCGLAIAGQFSWVRRCMEIRGSNITPVYGGDKRKTKAGHCLIQPPVGVNGLLDDLLGIDYTLITFDHPAQELLNMEEYAKWQHCGTMFLCLRPEGDTSKAYQAFGRWLGECQRRLLVVRPDRFVSEDRLLPD
jgi:3-(3-hydroxy-phenyl)propionate hydroxylase